ncbi:MAG TPA: serine hydrolase domain-containing protein [Methylomirabilota bacterium]|nr:serine hydrolase domain-containing protein [Methylomirabilota bacterium]
MPLAIPRLVARTWLCVLAATFLHPALAAEIEPARLDQASALAEAEMQRQGMPGMVLVVMQGDEPILARGFGRESLDRDDPVTPDTVFMYNSISKQLVAAAILKLAEAGQLSVDDLVSRHLPDWTRLPPGLSIRHLLTHTSGMRDVHVQPTLAELYDRPGTTWAQFAAADRDTPADFAPGSRWSYSNNNYLMLTLVVERATGRPLDEALEALLFRPLGLSSIRLCPSQPGGRRGEARGHLLRDGTLAGHPPEPVHLFTGAGGFCGTAPDLARWTRALATGQIVSPASYSLMTERAPLEGADPAYYGFGLALVCPDGVRRVGHGGYGGGFGAQAAYYPEAALTIVVIGNRFLFPERIERRVVRELFDLSPPPFQEMPTSAEERRRFAGAFDVGVHEWRPLVEERDGRLWFVLPGPRIEFPLIRVGENELAGADDADGYRLTFSPDGREMKLLGMGLMIWYGRRVAP